MELTHQLNRTVNIQAPPETVFRFFEDSERWARWWGAGSTIDPRPGGKVYIRYPNGVEVFGDIVEIAAPERIVFTYGYASGKPIPPGASRVTILLKPIVSGTLLELRHDFAEAAVRDQHVQGWRFQVSVFANLVADETFANAAELVDAWFAAWASQSIAEDFAKLASRTISFHDRYSALEGLDELTAHVAAAQRFMPGIALERKGAVRHCQGVLLADWVGRKNGAELMSGTNIFVLGPDRKFTNVVGVLA